jgi:hypothetical protein
MRRPGGVATPSVKQAVTAVACWLQSSSELGRKKKMMIKKAEKITDSDDLKNAKEQSQAKPWPISDRGIIERRGEGNQVYYRIVDPCAIDLLERGLWLTRDTKLRKETRRGRRTPQRELVQTLS